MKNTDVKQIFDYQYSEWVGIVVDNRDPLKMGRVKINVRRFFGNLETVDIPWAYPIRNSSGSDFGVPTIGKIVNVIFPNGDIYHPQYSYAEHNNKNLQNKIESLDVDDYVNFAALSFSSKFQFYTEQRSEGLVVDYVKSKFRITPDGDMILNLRNNNSVLYLGSESGDDNMQSLIHGDRFMDWFRRFLNSIQNASCLTSSVGGPTFFSAEGVQLKVEFDAIDKSIKNYLSDHVKVVDNQSVVANNRAFDVVPESDKYIVNDVSNTESNSSQNESMVDDVS